MVYRVNDAEFKSMSDLTNHLHEILEGANRIKFFYVSSDHTFESHHYSESSGRSNASKFITSGKAWHREMDIMARDYLLKQKKFRFIKDDKMVFLVTVKQ